MKAEQLNFTSFCRSIATRPLDERHIVDCISQLCIAVTNRTTDTESDFAAQKREKIVYFGHLGKEQWQDNSILVSWICFTRDIVGGFSSSVGALSFQEFAWLTD